MVSCSPFSSASLKYGDFLNLALYGNQVIFAVHPDQVNMLRTVSLATAIPR